MNRNTFWTRKTVIELKLKCTRQDRLRGEEPGKLQCEQAQYEEQFKTKDSHEGFDILKQSFVSEKYFISMRRKKTMIKLH